MKTKNVLLSIIIILALFSCKQEKKNDQKNAATKEMKKDLTKVKKALNLDPTFDDRIFKINGITAVPMNVIKINCSNTKTAVSGFQKIHQNCVNDNNFDLLGNFFTKYDPKTKTTILNSLEVKMDRKNTNYYILKVIKKNFNPKNRIKELVVHLTEAKDNSLKSISINEVIKTNDIIDIHIFKPNGDELGDTQCPVTKRKDNIKYNFCASVIQCN